MKLINEDSERKIQRILILRRFIYAAFAIALLAQSYVIANYEALTDKQNATIDAVLRACMHASLDDKAEDF